MTHFSEEQRGEGWHTFYILGLGRSGKWKNRGLKMERKKKKRGREGRKTQIWFPPGKLGHCAAAFLRFMGIGAGILRGTLNFLTLSSLSKHFQLPNNTHISNDHVMVKARSRLCNSLSLCCCKKKKKNWTKTCVPRSLKYSALHLQKLGIFSLSSHSPSLFPPPPNIIALPFVSAPEVEKQSGFMRFSCSDCLKVCYKNKQTNKQTVQHNWENNRLVSPFSPASTVCFVNVVLLNSCVCG